MSIRQILETLEQISEISMLAGIRGQIEEERMQFVVGVGLDNGRRQVVYVRDSSLNENKPCVTILSPCLRVKKRLFGGITKDMAIDLLRRNEKLHFARYGLWEANKETMIVASADYLVSTLDPEEFGHAVIFVAMAADTYESEHGQDEF